MPGPIATVGSMHTCPMCSGSTPHIGGPIIKGEPNILINNKPAATMGSLCTCAGPPDTVAQGDPFVFFNGKSVACLGDMTAHGGVISSGEANIIISNASQTSSVTMDEDEIPFPTISIKDRILTTLTGNSNRKAETNQNNLKENEDEKAQDITLTSTFAVTELQKIAKKDSLILFTYVIKRIYGNHYKNGAVEKLYNHAKENNALLNPQIKVVKSNSINGKGPAGYSNKTQEILVTERFVRKAKEDNDQRAELMVALVEEVGHHIHYLLHNTYTVGKDKENLPPKKGSQGDVGAKFAAQVIQLNLLENEEQYFADVVIDGTSEKLIWEWRELHSNLKQYVNEARQNRSDNGEINNYKAGKIDVGHGKYGHQDIEEVALKNLIKRIYKITNEKKLNEILNKIYLGNWLRDFSQLVDPGIIRPLSNSVIEYSKKEKEDLEEVKNIMNGNPSDDIVNVEVPYGVDASYGGELFSPSTWFSFETNIIYQEKKVRPITWSRELMTSVVNILAVMEFMKPENKADLNKNNYDKRLADFKKQYLDITKEVLGVYRPDEHIDNPLTIPINKNEHNPKLNAKGEKYGFVGKPTYIELAIGKTYGMKNYIRTHASDANSSDFSTTRTAYEYVVQQIKSAENNLNFSNITSMVNFGAALHVIEDYFAHTNYVEIAVAKVYKNDRVFPWVDVVPNHTPYPGAENFNYDTFAKLPPKEAERYLRLKATPSVIGVTKMKYDKTVITEPNQIARFIPVVTGTFGELDMLASVLPILEEKLFSIEITPYEESKPKERTVNDVLILEICRDLDQIQNADGSGVNDGSYEKRFNDLLEIRDGIVGAKNKLPKFMREYAHDIMERIGALINFGFYNLLKICGKRISDAQLLMQEQITQIAKNGIAIGTNPSHTQIAKDDPDKPMHELSAILAVEAVKKVGKKMLKVWKLNAPINDVLKEVDTIMQHPVVSSWQDKIVLEWATKNNDKVCRASTPSVVIDSLIHGIEEINDFNKQLINMADGKINGTGKGFTTMDAIISEFDTDGSLRENFKNLLLDGQKLLDQAKNLKNNYNKQYYKPSSC
ncbi:HET-C-related protein [Tenacibaculum ascidiaceicola]|uniref:HET-C-related protein n=1 Tax=Tenacibaculum ascidiaceicola TaxID=1699411 RepID=UPI003892DCB9